MLSQPSAHTHRTISLPLGCIVDLVNNVYLFSELSHAIGAGFAEQFRISRKIAESGPWWRICYGVWFHAAIKQIVDGAEQIPSTDARGASAQIGPAEAAQLLPCVGVVREILALWRDPEQPEDARRAAVLDFFPQDVRRIIEPADAEPVLTQFHEEGHVQRGRAVLSFFAYLDQCPLPDADDAPITLRQAVQYWGWIDNVKAFRTFFREEAVKNVRVRRMQQAVQLYRLVERVRAATGVDLGLIQIAVTEQLEQFLATTPFEQVALIADAYGADPLIDTEQEIFIAHASLGAAINALLCYLPPRAAPSSDDPATFAAILRATAENIANHDRLLERAQMRAAAPDAIDDRAVYHGLLLLADELEATAVRALPSSLDCGDTWAVGWDAWEATLLDARALIELIGEQEPQSGRALAGLERVLAHAELLALC